jgi:hypothetical protein
MCESCEEAEKRKEIEKSQQDMKIGCQKCKSTKIADSNRECTDPKVELERIRTEIKKQHKELIAGYDKQLADCLMNSSRFITKILIMYEDYMKKGGIDECVKILETIKIYLAFMESSVATAHTTVEMLIDKAGSID